MGPAHDERWRAFTEHVQAAPGRLTPAVRRAVFTAACGTPADVPENLGPFTELVAERSYRVTDRDVEALRDSGYSEDQIFEAIVVASAGAAQRRLDAARRAIREA